MSPKVTITLSGFSAEQLRPLSEGLTSRADLHQRIATDAETFVKENGAQTASTEHRSANTLGATPTGHLLAAYEQIQSVSSAEEAALLVPRASRLRAAFGAYVAMPGAGRKFLTIPACAEAYGHRAGEFGDLFFVRAGPQKTPILARAMGPGQIQTMYVLTPSANIPEDPTLLDFPAIQSRAAESAGAFLDEILKKSISQSVA